jgi:hypothetical protein
MGGLCEARTRHLAEPPRTGLKSMRFPSNERATGIGPICQKLENTLQLFSQCMTVATMGGPLRGRGVWVLNGSLVVAAALILTVGTQTGTAHALEVSFLTARVVCVCVCDCVCDCVCV